MPAAVRLNSVPSSYVPESVNALATRLLAIEYAVYEVVLMLVTRPSS